MNRTPEALHEMRQRIFAGLSKAFAEEAVDARERSVLLIHYLAREVHNFSPLTPRIASDLLLEACAEQEGEPRPSREALLAVLRAQLSGVLSRIPDDPAYALYLLPRLSAHWFARIRSSWNGQHVIVVIREVLDQVQVQLARELPPPSKAPIDEVLSTSLQELQNIVDRIPHTPAGTEVVVSLILGLSSGIRHLLASSVRANLFLSLCRSLGLETIAIPLEELESSAETKPPSSPHSVN